MHGVSIPHSLISYGFLAALAIALAAAAVGDLAHRRIANRLNGAIALAAPLFWWAGGLSPGAIGGQLALALGCLGISTGLFAVGAMGGGDVKLLTALALWIRPMWFAQLLVVMALAGGVLALLFVVGRSLSASGTRRAAKRQATAGLPYGVAIAVGGLWVLARDYLPMAGAHLPTGMIGS